MGKLDGKHVIVTGASRGIGETIAHLFAAEGGKVICAARTLNEGDHMFAGSVSSTVADIRAKGFEAFATAAGRAATLAASRAAFALARSNSPGNSSPRSELKNAPMTRTRSVCPASVCPPNTCASGAGPCSSGGGKKFTILCVRIRPCN